MPVPYIPMEMFSVSSNIEIEIYNIDGIGPIFICDNFYTNPDAIHDMLIDAHVPAFKKNYLDKNLPSFNFEKYYDCRLTIEDNYSNDTSQNNNQRIIWDAIDASFDMCKVVRSPEPGRFNLFKWIETPTQNFQQFPHTDSDTKVAGIVYLDKHSEGGTAFYHVDGKLQIETTLGYKEENDIRVDLNALGIKYDIVDAKYNRLVVYPGWYMHGGYISNHEVYTKNWRLNQVFFWNVKRDDR